MVFITEQSMISVVCGVLPKFSHIPCSCRKTDIMAHDG